MTGLLSMRTYFAAAGHEVDAVTFAQMQLRQQKALLARTARSGTIVPRGALMVLDVELDRTAVAAPARAYVNHGNWLWKCECGGCEFVDLEALIGVCCSCWNAAHGHRFRAILLPAEREAIERVLMERPVPNRNWYPGESVERLVTENAAGGDV